VSRCVLIVDDSMTIRKLVSKVVLAAGFEVLEAGNGKEALERLQGRAVDLVITDLNMPVMDGLEFIRAVREDETRKFTPVVFLTTEIDETKKEQAREAGATGWIVKPFHPDKVMTLVRRILT
jgi:two-component system, chemotaxis family, chemotaxis protein CheY